MNSFDALLLLLLFALYIGVKVGQKSDDSDQTDGNNNDSELINDELSPDMKNCSEEEETEDFLNNKYLNTLLWPMTGMFDLTMPCHMSSSIKFFISIGWLSTLSYLSVNAITDLSKSL